MFAPFWQPRAKLMRGSGQSKRVWRPLGWQSPCCRVRHPGPRHSRRRPAAEMVVRALGSGRQPVSVWRSHTGRIRLQRFCRLRLQEAAGMALPRRSEDIVRAGDPLSKGTGRRRPGFFNTLGRRYSHVGIYIGDGRFVHAPARRGRVRVERTRTLIGAPVTTAPGGSVGVGRRRWRAPIAGPDFGAGDRSRLRTCESRRKRQQSPVIPLTWVKGCK